MGRYTKRINAYKIQYINKEWSKWKDLSKKPIVNAFHSIVFTKDVTVKQIEQFMNDIGDIYVD